MSTRRRLRHSLRIAGEEEEEDIRAREVVVVTDSIRMCHTSRHHRHRLLLMAAMGSRSTEDILEEVMVRRRREQGTLHTASNRHLRGGIILGISLGEAMKQRVLEREVCVCVALDVSIPYNVGIF